MISVCLASYNGEKFIRDQVVSILAQLGEEDELIISDDCSTDKTVNIVREFKDKRIKLFVNEKTLGYVHNFENALKNSSGDYIFFSDQDDVWVPNKIKTMLPCLKDNNYVISDAYITDGNLNIKDKMSSWRKYQKGYLRNLYKSVYMGCTSAFTKEIKDFSLPFPSSKHIQHDTWIGLLCELKFNVVYLDEPLIYYRRHENNTSGAGSKSTKSFFYKLRYRMALIVETLKRWINC